MMRLLIVFYVIRISPLAAAEWVEFLKGLLIRSL